MSTTAIAFLASFGLLTILTMQRAIWGFSLYCLSFFACPPFWWWGKYDLGGYRWNFYAGIIFLIGVILQRSRETASHKYPGTVTETVAIWSLLNATFVHYLLASSREVSVAAYTLLAKFVLLFFMILSSIRTRQDLRIALLSIVLGAGYIGYEATINDAGKFSGGRLEGIGAPGATGSNQLACLMATILPVIGGIILVGATKTDKLLALGSAPMTLNVLLMCNSRAAFLALLAAAIVLVLTARGRARKNAIYGVLLGSLTTYALLGDPYILERFLTTFAGSEERDSSAGNRLIYWKAGLDFAADHPLGSGGDGFKDGDAAKYLHSAGTDEDSRAIHNGFINEMCEWGVQGLAFRLLFIFSGAYYIWRAMSRLLRMGAYNTSFVASCLLAGITGFCVTSAFGDRLDSEWHYWMAAIAVAYYRLYGMEESNDRMQELNAADYHP